MSWKETLYLPFLIASLERETAKAVLVTGFNGRTDVTKNKWGERVGEQWLPKSQVIKDPNVQNLMWVAEWFCEKNSSGKITPAMSTVKPQSYSEIRHGNAAKRVFDSEAVALIDGVAMVEAS